MKRKVTIVLLCISSFLYVQIGIGTAVPNGALDIVSTSQGLLIPRFSLTANNIMAPVTNSARGSLVNDNYISCPVCFSSKSREKTVDVKGNDLYLIEEQNCRSLLIESYMKSL